MIWTFWGPNPQSPGWFKETMLNVIFDTYVTGVPLLIPAFHVRQIIGAAGRSA